MDPERVEVRLDHGVVYLPREYRQRSSYPSTWSRWTYLFRDPPSSILTSIPADVVAKNVPGYEVNPPWHDKMNAPLEGKPSIFGDTRLKIKEDIPLIIYALNAKELHASTTSYVEFDIWNKQGDYADRLIAREAETGYYRVYSNSDPSKTWYLLRVNPDDVPLTTGYEMTLGSCSESEHGGATGNKVSCTSDALIGNIKVQFRLSGQNMKHVLEVRKFIETLIADWLVK